MGYIRIQSGRNPFMIGFVASISNQGLILSISMYITTTKNKYVKFVSIIYYHHYSICSVKSNARAWL